MSLCRGCRVQLTRENARRSRDRYVGICRVCENEESRTRATKTATVLVRFEPEELDELKALCEEEERTVPQLARFLLKRYMKEKRK